LFVGVLILLFSIVLPISKLICTQIVLLGNAKDRSRKVLEFVAFKTSKWSMADVLVVAIFMAYVGFKSILDSQLKDLNVQSQSMSVITTNRTSLQPAFILFTTFVLFGLVLAEIIKRSASARAARDQKVA
jgi:predicted Co/Zn/Cd cation transporter (cation efflux family)